MGIASLGFECCGVNEFGDGLNLTASGTLDSVSIVLDSWGCQKGDSSKPTTFVPPGPPAAPAPGPCVTTPGPPNLPTFNVPITLNVYAVTATGTRVGALLGTEMATFAIPYRPSADPRCDSASKQDGNSADPGAYVLGNECVHGYPYTITFSNITMGGSPVSAPSQAIFSVAYNTSDAGYTPTHVPCDETVVSGSAYPADACGYDSLNVSANDPTGPGIVGTVIDENGIFAYLTNTAETCTSSSSLNDFEIDTSPGCWTGYHPQIQVTVNPPK